MGRRSNLSDCRNLPFMWETATLLLRYALDMACIDVNFRNIFEFTFVGTLKTKSCKHNRSTISCINLLSSQTTR